MPKPFLLRRPSGLYVRYWVPLALREAVGSNTIVRSLGDLRGDAARLEAARLGYALAQQFHACRAMAKKNKEGSGDLILVDHKHQPIKRPKGRQPYPDFIEHDYQVDYREDGSFSVSAEGPEEHARALETLRLMRETPPPLASSTKAARTLGEARDLFLVQFKEKNPAPATVHETVATLGLFVDIVGARRPMDQVGVDDVDTLRAVLAVWPARARVLPAYRGLGTKDIIKKAKKDQPPGINVRTKDKHLDNVRKFFGWAVQRHEMTHNPLSGVRLQTKAQKATLTRRGFTQAELAALFAPHLRAAHAGTPCYFWLPMLALHTGARLRELAQLRLVDVHQVEGIWGVDINYHAGPLKNTQSQRFVPLASAVIALGFLDYVNDVRSAGFERVFPDGSWTAKNGPGDKVSKWFNRGYTRDAGLTDPALVFHSFRHTFADTADGVGLTEAQIGAITGHQSDSVLGQHYIRRKTVLVRQKHIDATTNQFKLPPQDAYVAEQFAEVFAGLKKKQAQEAAVAARERRQSQKNKKVRA
jgi:integrase